MVKPSKVARNNYKYTHGYLLNRPKLCVLLSITFSMLGWALYKDWLGHSNNSVHWESKNMMGAGIAWFAASMLALYAAKGFAKRSST